MPTAKKTSRVTKRPQKPSVALSKVPPIKKLHQLLGFQRASLNDMQSFIDATHAWQNSYKTSNTLSASELLRWNEPAIQLELKAMAEKFLHDGANAERFWDADRSWFYEADLKFPEDTEK
jgi:hypothetical protein